MNTRVGSKKSENFGKRREQKTSGKVLKRKEVAEGVSSETNG